MLILNQSEPATPVLSSKEYLTNSVVLTPGSIPRSTDGEKGGCCPALSHH